MKIYRTNLELRFPVLDLGEAQKYLSENDTTKWLLLHLADDYTATYLDPNILSKLKEDVVSIEWILENEEKGYIELQAKRELTTKELDIISSWVIGQNSDGLGESFAQKDFAIHEERWYDEETDEYQCEYYCAEIDPYRDYKFNLIQTTNDTETSEVL